MSEAATLCMGAQTREQCDLFLRWCFDRATLTMTFDLLGQTRVLLDA